MKTQEIFKQCNFYKSNNIALNFAQYQKNVYSQSGEDGVIDFILNKLNIDPSNQFYVEFGAWDGTYLSNTANLRINKKWNGILFEGDANKVNSVNNKALNLHHEFITDENINIIFDKYKIPSNFGVLSIDIDSNDVFVFESLDTNKYNPLLIVIEFNPGLPNHVPIRIIKNKDVVSRGYFNANLHDIYNVVQKHNYEFVTTVGVNAFFVKSDIFYKLNIEKVEKNTIISSYNASKYAGEWGNIIRQYNDEWIIN